MQSNPSQVELGVHSASKSDLNPVDDMIKQYQKNGIIYNIGYLCWTSTKMGFQKAYWTSSMTLIYLGSYYNEAKCDMTHPLLAAKMVCYWSNITMLKMLYETHTQRVCISKSVKNIMPCDITWRTLCTFSILLHNHVM